MSSQGRGNRGRGGGGGGDGGRSAGDRGRGRGRGSGNSDDRGRGGSPRGGLGGRGRAHNFGIWQEGVQAVHPPQLKEEEDRIVARFNAEKDESPKFPLRPGWGTQGQPGVVRANFFAIRLPKDPIYEYTVRITPDPGWRRAIKERIFQLLERHPRISPLAPFIAHDKCERLVSARRLEQPLKVTVDHTEEGAPAAPAKRYQVELTLRHTFDPNQLTKFCNGDLDERYWDFQPFVSALNVIIRKSVSAEAIHLWAHRYSSPALQDRQNQALSPALLAFKGFHSSVRPSLGRVVLNVNVCMTPFYAGGSLTEAISRFQQRTQGGLPSRFLRGVKLVTRHLGYNRKHILTEILGAPGPADVFIDCQKYSPPRISVADYFLREYNIQLNPNLPVVRVGGASRPVYLPAELCEVIEQPYRSWLTDQERENLVRCARNPPATNAASIVNDGLRVLGLRDGPSDGFNIVVEQEMIAVPIRVLPPPQLSYGAGRPTVSGGSWNILSVKFKRAATLPNWGIICVLELEDKGIDRGEVEELATAFRNKLRACGMTVPNPPRIVATRSLPDPKQDPGRRNALNCVEEAIQKLGTPLPRMILFLLSRKDHFIYPGVKALVDTKLGVHSICMQLRMALKKQDQYFSNLALKVNTKLGGINHTVDDRALGWLKTTPTMVVGMDTSHPNPGSVPGTPSVAAVVANVDDMFAQFPVSLRIQGAKREIIQDLTEMMVERLQAYKTASNTLPQRVIIYRAGVSEGKYDCVLQEEFDSKIKESFGKVGGGSKYEPKVTIIVCGRGRHTRFFPTTAEQKLDNGNALPGTIQDRGLSSPFLFDFYLQAHPGLQGHTRPIHYTIICDENHLDADTIQQGTYNFSYQYARATTAVSLVPPAYYADLACKHARCYLNQYYLSTDNMMWERDRTEVLEEITKEWRGVHDNLEESMFYI